MFSKTLSRGKMFVTWKLRDSPRRLIMNGARPVMLSPFSRTSPELTGKRPLTRWNSVDLPAPLGPMMACRSPWCTSRLTPRMICVRAEALAQVDQLQRRGAS